MKTTKRRSQTKRRINRRRTTKKTKRRSKRRSRRQKRGGFPPALAAIGVAATVGPAMHSARCSILPNSWGCGGETPNQNPPAA